MTPSCRDKHEYSAYSAQTDPETCLLTGERALEKRIPDATLGLAIFARVPADDPCNSRALCEDKLERLLLHPKSGLISDPRWGHNKMVFPWAVYEAKGWSGDCKEARRQACAAGERYLTMLDHLAREPGPPSTGMKYQTQRSHDFQVFVFTSIGSHWHVLVGCKHDRLPEQHAGMRGMSKTVSVSHLFEEEVIIETDNGFGQLFRKIWSGSISNQRGAWELLSLVDQIHEWASTTFRDFVTEHLNVWHAYSDENFLLDWDTDDENSKKPQSPKRKRELHNDKDLKLPKWCNYIDPPLRNRMQVRAKAALKKMVDEEQERKRKLEVIKRVFPPPSKERGITGQGGAPEDLVIDWPRLVRKLKDKKRKLPDKQIDGQEASKKRKEGENRHVRRSRRAVDEAIELCKAEDEASYRNYLQTIQERGLGDV